MASSVRWVVEWPEHRPSNNRPYGINWAPLLASGETVVSSTWDVPAALTNPDNEAGIIDGSKTWVRLTGGTFGRKYSVTNTVVTSLDNTHQAVADLGVARR